MNKLGKKNDLSCCGGLYETCFFWMRGSEIASFFDGSIYHVTIFRDILGFFIFMDVMIVSFLFLFLSMAIHFLRFLKIEIC